jgi:hypothetical protein
MSYVDFAESENQAFDKSTGTKLPWGSGKVRPVEAV